MGLERGMLRRAASRARVGDAASAASRKKKQNVMEIDGVLWALDEHGNPLKRLRKKNKEGENQHPDPPQHNNHNNSSGASVNTKRIKKNILEIDGQPWLCDDDGNPIKKLRKKVKEGEEPPARSKSRARNGGGGYDSDGASSRGSNRRRGQDDMSRGRSNSRARPQHHSRSDSDSSTSDRRPRKPQSGSLEALMHSGGESTSTGDRRKKKVVEIDGQLWACDDHGNPVKKVRRKGDPKPAAPAPSDERSVQRERGRSRGPAPRDNGANHANHARSKSTPNRPGQPPPQAGSSYTDAKGRKHVFDEFGNETVFDRNGKKLRKKGEQKSGGLLDQIMVSSGMGSFYEPPRAEEKKSNDGGRDLEFGIFNELWDDLEGKAAPTKTIADVRKSLNLTPVVKPDYKRSHTAGDIHDDPDELDRRNKMLLEELRRAKEEMRELEEQAKKEKAKNLKAQADMMQLKADFTQASTELEDLRCKVYDLTSDISRKEKELAEAREKAAAIPSGGGEGIAELEAEKDNLASKLEMERATAQQEIKKKEEQLANMNREMSILRNEVEMLITGRKGNEVDPTLKRLMEEKQEVETKYNAEKEKNQSKIKSLEEMIEALETVNTELNKQMLQNAGAGGGMRSAATARNNIHNRANRRESNFERKAPEPSKSFEGGVGGFSLSPGALFGRGRFARNTDGQ